MWAHEGGLLESNSGFGLMRCIEAPKKRGVLSPEEAKAIFSL